MGELVSPPLSLHPFFSPFSHLPLLESSFATSRLLAAWTFCPARGWGWEREGGREKQEEGWRT